MARVFCGERGSTEDTLSNMPNTNQQTDLSRVNATPGVSEGYRITSGAYSSNGSYASYVDQSEIISPVSPKGGFTNGSGIDLSAGSSGGHTRLPWIYQSANSSSGYKRPVPFTIDQSAGSATGYVRPYAIGQSVLSSEGYDVPSKIDQLAGSSGGYAKMTFKTGKYDVPQLGQTEIPNFYRAMKMRKSGK
ncbi:hypothetical protein PoB_002450700 [Plakobranchus ocellatus]|uniref:Uncharacterized protein n=1 Tax=Plakobranchus ocellatus TaxID=259542 RepID=A0AAV3ZTY2_9GAST|nr:hypothetical protein PoB_002450700 [Plakobranchus ocellatus]